MIRSVLAAFLMLSALHLTACISGSSQTAEQTYQPAVVEPDEFSEVTRYIEAGYRGMGLPGAALVVWQDGQVIYEKYFGAYSYETVVPLASASKWLSAAVIMTLVDDGLIDLDAPVSRYLTGFSGDMARMTSRQMFSHTSGLVDFPGDWDYTSTPGAFAAKVAREGIMRAKPGTEVRYAGASMQVVGAIAEKVTGRAWNDLFLERIAKPCGMTTTTFARKPINTNPTLAGNASSSMRDYGRFLDMIAHKGVCNGKRVISEASIAEMQRDQTGALPLVQASSDRRGRQSHYGLGEWLDEQAPDGRTIQVSSPGAFGFRPWLNLDRNLYGVFMMNRQDARDTGAVERSFDPWTLIDMVHVAADSVRSGRQ